MSNIFGPIPSRRLGYSLGIDVVPYKTCTLDCVYCQVGKTTERTLHRKEWVNSEHILIELAEAIARNEKIDYITFSGSGEPTLNSSLGKIIRRIKKMCSTPIAVLTNGTLLYLPEVRDDLMDANLVVPSLDAVDLNIFNIINRPHPDLNTDNIIEGIKLFRKSFSGHIWLEVMIVKGINDSRETLTSIGKVAKEINPDKIQINSVFRPAVEKNIESVDRPTLEFVKEIFGKKAEIIEEFQKRQMSSSQDDIQDAIMQLLQRRPCSIKQISQSLGFHQTVIVKHVRMLFTEGRLQEVLHGGERFYKVS